MCSFTLSACSNRENKRKFQASENTRQSSRDSLFFFVLQELEDAVMTCTREGGEPEDTEEKTKLPSSPNHCGLASASGTVSGIQLWSQGPEQHCIRRFEKRTKRCASLGGFQPFDFWWRQRKFLYYSQATKPWWHISHVGDFDWSQVDHGRRNP